MHCARYASPRGSDTAAGTSRAPFRSVERLAEALHAGQTGCLRAGAYRGYLRISHGGRRNARLQIRSLPGVVATLIGRVWIRPGSNYVTIQGVRIAGAHPVPCTVTTCPNMPTVAVNGDSATLADDEITNDHSTICLAIGSAQFGTAHATLIESDAIHGCGRLPATNSEHGIYIADAVRAVIRDSYVYDNADRGIQLYPHARSSLVEGNVIDRNGEGILIGGADGSPSAGSLIEHNLITNSRLGGNVESFFPAQAPPAGDNRVVENCLFGGRVSPAQGGLVGEGTGFSADRNVIADPHYRARSASGRAQGELLAPEVRGPCADVLAASR